MLINMARSGQIRQMITESQLVGLLDQVSNIIPSNSSTKVTVSGPHF